MPHFTGTLALLWFLAGLVMLFGAGMVGYLFIRMSRIKEFEIGSLTLPHSLWVSTALVLLASASIQAAVASIRRERQDLMRAWLLVTLIVGILFCIIQGPALANLFHQHLDAQRQFQAAKQAAIDAGQNPLLVRFQPFFGLIMVYIFIHAAHVLGGIVHLIAVTRNAFLGRYDHEYYNPVKHAAMYWHFLDIVWLIMFGTMVAAG